MNLTKYALNFLALFLFLTLARSASAQSFMVQSGSPLHIEGACGDEIYDSSIVLKNLTSSPLKISVQYQYIGYRSSISSPTIPPLGTAKVVFYFLGAHEDSSISLSTAKFSAGTDTIPVPITVVMKPYAVCAYGWQDVYMQDVKVGETRCATYWGRNRSQKPISFYGANAGYDTVSFKLHPLVPTPYVILPGEDLPLFDVCFTATHSNQYASTRLSTSFSAYDCDSPAPLDISARAEVDSILLQPCMEFLQNKDIYGPALLDGDSFDTVFVRNNRYRAISLDSIIFTVGDVSTFSFVESFPQVLQPLEKRPLTLKFSPRTTSPIVKYRFATSLTLSYPDSLGDPYCNPKSVDIVGLAMDPTSDTTASPLFPDKDYFLGMSGTSPSFSKDFHFVNNGTSNVKIVAVALSDPSPEFAITGIQPTSTLPFTLAPGEKMTVTVLFTPSKPGKVFYNQLVITTENGLVSHSFPIEGLQLSSSGVKKAASGSAPVLNIYPNPSVGSITVSVDGAREIYQAEIFDILGISVLSKTGRLNSTWTWDLSGHDIEDGTYFLRMQGRTFDDEPFTTTKKLVIQH
jgi:hypothetical protein